VRAAPSDLAEAIHVGDLQRSAPLKALTSQHLLHSLPQQRTYSNPHQLLQSLPQQRSRCRPHRWGPRSKILCRLSKPWSNQFTAGVRGCKLSVGMPASAADTSLTPPYMLIDRIQFMQLFRETGLSGRVMWRLCHTGTIFGADSLFAAFSPPGCPRNQQAACWRRGCRCLLVSARRLCVG
jgi:hypothetical protein